MTAAQIIKEIESLGTPSYKKVLLNHGVREPVFGVKIEHLKKIQKRVGKDHALALGLYETGIYDAQYLAGLIADETRMTAKDLRRWLATANCATLCATAVAWVAAESQHGMALALEWIDSKDPTAATTGWTTLAALVGVRQDADLDLPGLKRLLARVGRTIHEQPDKVRYAMNGFVIAVGTYVEALSDLAEKTGVAIGPVSVDMGDTECKVPYAPAYIQKVRDRGAVGRKRKQARC